MSTGFACARRAGFLGFSKKMSATGYPHLFSDSGVIGSSAIAADGHGRSEAEGIADKQRRVHRYPRAQRATSLKRPCGMADGDDPIAVDRISVHQRAQVVGGYAHILERPRPPAALIADAPILDVPRG